MADRPISVNLRAMDRSFWAQRWKTALGGAVLGYLFVLIWHIDTANVRGVFVLLWPMMALFSSPHTPKTSLGRLWWICYLTLLECTMLTAFTDLLTPAGVLLTMGTVFFAAVTVCLRWRPPFAPG